MGDVRHRTIVPPGVTFVLNDGTRSKVIHHGIPEAGIPEGRIIRPAPLVGTRAVRFRDSRADSHFQVDDPFSHRGDPRWVFFQPVFGVTRRRTH